MGRFFKIDFNSFLLVIFFIFLFSPIVSIVKADLGDAANGTVGGADGGYTDGSGPSFGGGDYTDPSTSIGDTSSTSDASGGDSSSLNFTDYVAEQLGLGQQAGTNPGGAMGLGDLSNLNPTIDNGVVASYEVPDAPANGATILGLAPVLSAAPVCLGIKPVVYLFWTGTPLTGVSGGYGSSTWRVIRSNFTGSLAILPAATQSFTDMNVAQRTIYYYRVYSYDGGNSRSPLSNVMAVYSPNCPVYGYVYQDADSSGTITSGDFGLTGETVQVIRPYYVVQPAYEVVTSTDENGNPTGAETIPAITSPETVMGTGITSGSGYYSISDIPPVTAGAPNYLVRNLKSPMIGWTRTTPNDVSLSTYSNPYVSFGLFNPLVLPSASPSPSLSPDPSQSPLPSPITPPTPPIVSLYINGITSGGLPVTVNQNSIPQPNLTWQVGNTPNNSCTASVTSVGGSSIPAALMSAWSGTKGPPPMAPNTGGPVVLSTYLPGSFLFFLTCTNNVGTTTSSIQLDIIKYPPPYFKTTGGDVHTNETIFITPATP